MTKKEIKKRIESVLKRKNSLDEEWQKVYDIFGENNLEDGMWELFDAYLKSVEELIGDKHGVLGFFIFDCEQGKTKRTFNVGGEAHEIHNIKDVLKTIKELQR